MALQALKEKKIKLKSGFGDGLVSLGREKEEQQLMSQGTPAPAPAVAKPHMWLPSAPQGRKAPKFPFCTLLFSLSRCSLRRKGQILLLLWEFGETEAGGGEVPVSPGAGAVGNLQNRSGMSEMLSEQAVQGINPLGKVG